MGFLDKVLKGAVNAIEDAVEKNSGSKSGSLIYGIRLWK